MDRAFIAAIAMLCACGRGDAPSAPAPSVQFDLAAGPLSLAVEVAADPQSRSTGLMHRPKVPAGTGMLFLYVRPGSWGGIWMKNTLVPLDVAFVRAGRVVHLVTLQPCRADPCPVTEPPAAYDAVIEAAAGELVAAGVAPGTKVSFSWVTVSPG